ncbi:hypothetical protein K438DRAFT_347583 [Mycena galopus ATCC 62051]|nr:hypothetical protein K438DRAFT_347583 [Mycena galopus ATCC 62051]
MAPTSFFPVVVMFAGSQRNPSALTFFIRKHPSTSPLVPPSPQRVRPGVTPLSSRHSNTFSGVELPLLQWELQESKYLPPPAVLHHRLPAHFFLKHVRRALTALRRWEAYGVAGVINPSFLHALHSLLYPSSFFTSPLCPYSVPPTRL